MANVARMATKRRRVETDLQRILLDGAATNKRQKVCTTPLINSNNNCGTSASKCAPLSPLPPQPSLDQQSQDQQKLQKSIGPYRILAPLEENSQIYTAADTRVEGRLVICRRLDRSKYAHLMNLAHRLSCSDKNGYSLDGEGDREAYEQIFPSKSEMFMGDDGHFYYFEPKNFGSLHAYVVERKRLSEQECLRFARQIVRLLVFCHQRRVILRDLKLRKFVFADEERTTIRLDGIDELFVCSKKSIGDDESECDKISDRHGCPAYVGPEILDLNQKSYSGRAADVWSLGVLLFVILYGRYPFYDTSPARLFAKIRHAQIHMLEEAGISFEARTFIRCLLRRDPKERPTAMDILAHPWLQSGDRANKNSSFQRGPNGSLINAIPYNRGRLLQNMDGDQMVPCVDLSQLNDGGKKNQRANNRQMSSDEPSVPN